MSFTELTITGFDEDRWITCQNPYKIASVKRYFAPKNQNAQSFIEYLERTNRVCSQAFALFIPVNVTSFSDVFCPWTVHYALGSNKKGFSKYAYIGGSLLADLITLVFRLVVLIPRGIYKCTQIPAIKLDHPIRHTRTSGMDNELPIEVDYNNRKFYFALNSMHAIQAHRYFIEAGMGQDVDRYDVTYSEIDTKAQAELNLLWPKQIPSVTQSDILKGNVPLRNGSVVSSVLMTKCYEDYNKHFERSEETNSSKEYDNYGPLAFTSLQSKSVIMGYSSTACVGHLRTFLHFNYGYPLSVQIVYGGKVLKDDEVLSQNKSKGSTFKVGLSKTT